MGDDKCLSIRRVELPKFAMTFARREHIRYEPRTPPSALLLWQDECGRHQSATQAKGIAMPCRDLAWFRGCLDLVFVVGAAENGGKRIIARQFDDRVVVT